MEECVEPGVGANIKRVNYVFRPISDVEQIMAGAMVDVVAAGTGIPSTSHHTSPGTIPLPPFSAASLED